MGRDRSHSRERVKSRKDDRDRDRHKESRKDRDRHKTSRRSKSRSRSPRHSRRDKHSPSPPARTSRKERRRSPSPDYLTLGNVKPKVSNKAIRDGDPIILDPLAYEGKTEEEIEMMKMMGFSGFDTTKNKQVDGSANAFAVNIQQKRKYRQYMNRKGGFNRPLDSCL